MGRPAYQITPADYSSAAGWISRHLSELPPEASQVLAEVTNHVTLQCFVDRFFIPDQRRRLHTAIRQIRHRAQKNKGARIELDAATTDQLYQLTEWLNEKSATDLIRKMINNRWLNVSWDRVKEYEKRTGKQLSYKEALAFRAGQKLDK